LDADLLPYLQNIPNVTLLNSDVRKIDLCAMPTDRKIRVTGNLPYYISSNILTSLILQRKCIQDMTLMFQEEVAHRITAPPSDPDYGYLSVITQYYCNIQKGLKINKNCIFPKPQNESRILRFTVRSEPVIEFEEFGSYLEKAFSQRRKKLRNNLLRALPIPPEALDRIFGELQIAPDVRAENLSADQYEKLILKIRQH
jgi:16S rRNA (adenine1518-N6/adenine1519-N6)-dimethyltransferase